MTGTLHIAISILVCLVGVHQAHSSVHRVRQKPAETFRVIWNSPTNDCEKRYGISIDVTKYGICENEADKWMGGEVSLFYSSRLGLYPSYSDTGTPINGGLPQLGNLSQHLEKVRYDIAKDIPDEDFKGLGVIDWESWRPVWDRDYDSKSIYQHKSEAKVRATHPDWTNEQIKAKAKEEFQKAARGYMEKTLRLLETLRHFGMWGFYGFPRCSNERGGENCPATTMAQNDGLLWLFNASSALYPSAYLSAKIVNATAFVSGQVREAFRVRSLLGVPHKPVYIYATYRQSAQAFYTQVQLTASLGVPAALGVDGVVLWGAGKESDSQATCEQLKDYLDTTLGPYVFNLLNHTHCTRDSYARRQMSNGNSVNKGRHHGHRIWSHLVAMWHTILSWFQ